jgi:hypothetical protein
MKNKLKQIMKFNSQSNTILTDKIKKKKSIKKNREKIGQLGNPLKL